MRVIVILATLLCVLFASQANARPKHHIDGVNEMIGCADPVMRPCSMRSVVSRNGRTRPIRPGLRRVLAEGAGRAVNWIKPPAWCGWFMRHEFGVANPAANVARWWAGYGRPAHGPHVGAIVVWRHHVGRITGRTADGRWIVKSGNDGHRVRERPRSVAGAIAFRWPA
jgi:hypothetical protein